MPPQVGSVFSMSGPVAHRGRLYFFLSRHKNSIRIEQVQAQLGDLERPTHASMKAKICLDIE